MIHDFPSKHSDIATTTSTKIKPDFANFQGGDGLYSRMLQSLVDDILDPSTDWIEKRVSQCRAKISDITYIPHRICDFLAEKTGW